jgi:hypothetical protein
MKTFEFLTKEDVKEAVKEALSEELKSLRLSTKEESKNLLLNKKQVASILNVSVGTVDNLRRQGKLKSIPGIGKVLFKPVDVIGFIDSC